MAEGTYTKVCRQMSSEDMERDAGLLKIFMWIVVLDELLGKQIYNLISSSRKGAAQWETYHAEHLTSIAHVQDGAIRTFRSLE